MWVGEPTFARGGDEMTVGEYSAWRKRRDCPTPATGFCNTEITLLQHMLEGSAANQLRSMSGRFSCMRVRCEQVTNGLSCPIPANVTTCLS